MTTVNGEALSDLSAGTCRQSFSSASAAVAFVLASVCPTAEVSGYADPARLGNKSPGPE
jgi:hypothetical protein